MELSNDDVLLLACGRIRCRRCDGRNLHHARRCLAPAMRGKTKCYFHSGYRATGPRTEQGKANSAKANLKHGKYTKQAQEKHRKASAQLSQLEDAMYLLGMSDAPRCTGRKAKGYRPITSFDGVREALAETKND